MEHVIRTFGRVHGKKLSARQQWLVDNLLPTLSPIGESHLPPLRGECRRVNGDEGGPILEIGFGAGEHLLHLAKQNPDKIIIGAEPFINGVASLLSQMTKPVGAHTCAPSDANASDNIIAANAATGRNYAPLQLIKPEYKNIRIWPDDVRKLLSFGNSVIPSLQNINFCFTKIYILHPDPWPKARHEKRRLLSAEFLELLSKYLVPMGEIIIGTDHADYFDWIIEQIKKTSFQFSVLSSQFEPGLNTRYKKKDLFSANQTRYLILSPMRNDRLFQKT